MTDIPQKHAAEIARAFFRYSPENEPIEKTRDRTVAALMGLFGMAKEDAERLFIGVNPTWRLWIGFVPEEDK